MSKITSEDLLIIYESEAEQWARYLRSLLAGSIPETGICCYDIAMVTNRQDDFLQLSGYKCKLLILSRGLLEGLCHLRRFFLARVLQPEARVLVLLCGVEDLEPLLELVPLRGEECLQISSEQDAQEYRAAVAEIVRRGAQTSAVGVRQARDLATDREQPAVGNAKSTLLLLPCRVPCENPGQVFLLLRDTVAGEDPEVDFNGNGKSVRVKAAKWNENTFNVPAPDFPDGSVGVTLFCGGVVMGKALLHYYSTMGEISRLLHQAVDPVNFMCQAFQASSTEQVDHILASYLMQKMPTGGFQGLQSDQIHAGDPCSEDIPTLLHFAAEHGLRDLTSVLLQCPGAPQALRTTNRLGHTPLALAHARGHCQLHVLLQESLAMLSGEDYSDDTSVYELMGRAGNLQITDSVRTGDDTEQGEEDPYLGVKSEEYDTVFTVRDTGPVANRPPAPTPRPETFPGKEKTVPFIAQAKTRETRLCYDDHGLTDAAGVTFAGSQGETAAENETMARQDRRTESVYSARAAFPQRVPSAGLYRLFPQSPLDIRLEPASMFQKKTSQADSETLYSLPSKQSRGQDSDSSTYDTLVPSPPPGLDELIRLQEQVKRGSLSMDEALERFGDWQWVQRGKPGAQQDKLQKLRADITSSNADDSVYDKINIVHHTTPVPTEDCRRRNQAAEGDFYSKPVKAQHSRVFKKADKL